jgi:putative SOS response-associated peptidase YedK
MCGRYTAPFSGKDLTKRYGLNNTVSGFNATYNAAPGMRLPVITKNSPLNAVLMKWGFIAPWEKDFTKAKFKPINARDDKLSGGFYSESFKNRRCLVPCAGYYEWKKITVDGKSEKQPYYFSLKNEQIFSLGGFYSVHTDAEGMEHLFYTIITTPPNLMQKPIHDRMPLIIAQKDEVEWLESKSPEKFVIPFDSETFQAWKVATLVSSFRNDGPELINSL